MGKPEVGQKLFMLSVRGGARHCMPILTPVVVTKVGRKYFSVAPTAERSHLEVEFRLEGWRQHTEYSPRYFLYETEQEYLDKKERDEHLEAFRKVFCNLGGTARSLSLPTLRKIAEAIALDGVEKPSLDEQMRAAGMMTIDEMVAKLGSTNPLLLHAGVVDLESFETWLEMKCREYATMQAERQLEKRDDDEMFEWILAHAGTFTSVLAHYLRAKAGEAKVGG